jgi:methionyl aminopeptidase
MESFEVTIKGKTHKVKCIENLCGHSIRPYVIHAGKSVPIVDNGSQVKMEENEQYAIETFGSTGQGVVYNDTTDVSHYMMKPEHMLTTPKIKNANAAKLFEVIKLEFGSLAFCRKWLEAYFPKHYGPLKMLTDQGIIKSYPPLTDPDSSCYTAQFEHTILLRPTCKEILTRGDDF